MSKSTRGAVRCVDPSVAARRAVVPTPAVDRYACEVRAAAFMPGRRIVAEAYQLREGMRIGFRVLVGPTAEKQVVDPETREARWVPVVIRKDTNLSDIRWCTRCDCGTVRRVCVTSLVAGSALSCGCFTVARTRYCAAQRREARAAERAARELDAAYAEHAAEDRRIAREANRIARTARTRTPATPLSACTDATPSRTAPRGADRSIGNEAVA